MSSPLTAYRGLYGFISRHPRLILASALLLSVVAVVYTRQHLEFLTGRDDLMPKNTGFHRDYRAYRQEFGDQEEIVAVIESSDAEKAARFGDRLYERLRQDKKHFQDVFYPFGLDFFKKNGLLFMSLDEVRTLRQNLTLAKPALKELAASPSVQTLFTFLTREMEGYLASPAGPAADRRLAQLTFMLEKLGMGIGKFGQAGAAEFSLEEFFFQGKDGQESSVTKAGKQQVLTLLPVRDATSFVPAETAIKVLREEIARLRALPEFRGVAVGLTGTPVLEHEEMATSQKDIELATIISLALTVVLLLLAFRGVVNVLAAMLSLGVAICLSFGFATMAVGHLNILSMVFAIMLIGIGIEYGIQVVLRYQEELAGGAPQLDAIGTGLTRNIWAIVMAAATVAAAFLTFIFTDFKGIAELGIIAAGGVVICVLVTFTVLPASLVVLAPYRRKGTRDQCPGTDRGEPLKTVTSHQSPVTAVAGRLLFGYPRTVVTATVLLCLASLYPLSRTSFDYNLLNLQAKGLESVTYAYKLMRSKENAGYFAVVVADNAVDAASLSSRLAKLPTVDHVVSFASFVPDHQPEKLAELAALRAELADIRPTPYEENLRLMELPTVFENFRNTVERLNRRLAGERRPEAKPIGAFLATLDAFFARLEKEKDKNAVGMLKEFQGGMLAELPQKLEFLKASLNPAPVNEADVPAALKARFVGRTGKYLLQVAPKEEIFDLAPLKAFLDQVRSIAPHATGEPVMVYESMTIMRDAYKGAFAYAFLAIVLILFITFRSLRYTLIGLVPLVVGILFMVSGMWLSGISFNSANIIVMPLILGIAVDSGIYLINRFRREGDQGAALIASSTGQGVMFNTLTIMASFGALIVAHHRGVFSIGAVMSLGMVACQIAFIITLPAVLALFGDRR